MYVVNCKFRRKSNWKVLWFLTFSIRSCHSRDPNDANHSRQRTEQINEWTTSSVHVVLRDSRALGHTKKES
uniref:Putative secreted protein n=1 Tax=Anopheles triannulatus TaxID=58253 RepID=A0A2M4B506_9DIPT